MRLRLAVCALALTALAAPGPAAAQARPGDAVRTEDVVEWRVGVRHAGRGGEARVVFDAEIAPGWRLYALDSPVGRPLSVSLAGLPAGVEALGLRQSAPREGYDEAFESDYTYFSERGRIVQPLRVGGAARPGRYEVRGTVAYAVCDDSICLPPARAAFRVPLQVE